MSYFNEKIETMSRSDMTKLQSERLIETIARVYETVPTYRAKMDEKGVKPSDIKSIADISKLPFTTKKDLRDGYPFGMFSADMKDIVRIHASSGTTGKLTVAGYTKHDIDVWSECVARALVATGASKESMIQVAYGYGMFTGGLGLHYGAERLGSAVIPMSSGNTKRQIMLMEDFGTDTICCTPSYALFIAEEIKNSGFDLSKLKLKRGIFGAEPWSQEMRKEIEQSLNIKAYDIYGLSEISGPGVACECEAQDGLHINEDFFYPEIVDRNTLEPLPYGEEGELVFTTISKFGMPLIRYRTRDIASLSVEPCKCGRTLVKLGRIRGRNDDMLIVRGVNVFPSQIESVLLSHANNGVLPYYQIIVNRENNLDTMEIQVEISEELFSDTVGKIEELRAKLGAEMLSNLSVSAKITLVSPNSLPRSEGKAKRIIDNRVY